MYPYHHNEQGNISTSYNEQYLTSGNKYQYSAATIRTAIAI